MRVKWTIPWYLGPLESHDYEEKMKGLSSPRQMDIKPIPHSAANNFVLNHHYLRRKCYIARNVSYGVFFRDYLVGVCMYGFPVWRVYPGIVPPLQSAEVPELIRLSLLDVCPRNSASRVIALTIKLLRKDWLEETGTEPKAIFTMADKALGFSGSIYKASNFEFVRTTSGRPSNPGGAHGKWGANGDDQKAEKDVYIYRYRK